MASLWPAPRYGTQDSRIPRLPSCFRDSGRLPGPEPFSEQLPHALPDKPGAVTVPDHVGFDRCTGRSPGPIGKIVEMMLRPSMHGIVMHAGKRSFTQRDDPARHARVGQLHVVEGGVAVPPKADMGSLFPTRQQVQVGHGRGAEAMARNVHRPGILRRRANGRHAAGPSPRRFALSRDPDPSTSSSCIRPRGRRPSCASHRRPERRSSDRAGSSSAKAFRRDPENDPGSTTASAGMPWRNA